MLIQNERQEAERFPFNHIRPDFARANQTDWRIELPTWSQDQRSQMSGPADEADLVIKRLNSGAPGVMLDLEDRILDEELERILSELPPGTDEKAREKFREARRISEDMIVRGEFNPS